MIDLVQYLGPLLAAWLTVPVLGWIKGWLSLLDRAPAPVQQVAALLTAFGLAKLGAWIDVFLPGELQLFTGESLEALVTAGLAFAFHAGKKAKDAGTIGGPAVRTFAMVGLLFASVSCASAQSADSVIVTVVDRGSFATLITTDSARFRGAIGDTVTFEAIVVDTISGDTIPGVIRWTSNSAAVDINPTTGFATFLGGCGAARCEATIFADVAELVGFRIFSSYPDGVWRELEAAGDVVATAAAIPYVIEVGAVDLLCAYAFTRSGLWYRSSDSCPSRLPGVAPGFFPLPIDRTLVG